MGAMSWHEQKMWIEWDSEEVNHGPQKVGGFEKATAQMTWDRGCGGEGWKEVPGVLGESVSPVEL